jgi:cytochrome c553
MDGKRGYRAGVAGAGLAVLLLGVAGSCMTTGRRLPTTAREQMWSHFVQSAHLQYSVALGDVEAAREAAREIEETDPVPGIPPEALSELSVLRLRARDLQAATDLSSASMAAARVAAACGDCHRVHHRGPTFTDVAPAPDSDDVDHMVEHLWAADRMWEGLTIPSGDHWEAGARVLADHVVPMELLPRGTPGLGVRLKSLGLDALGDRSAADRAQRYAQILETCATCHSQAGVARGPQGW